MMQDTDVPLQVEQVRAVEPDSHIMGLRFIALCIDSLLLAFIISWCTKAFGTAYLGQDMAIPGILSSTSGTTYGSSIGSGNTTYWVIKLSVLWQILFVLFYFVLQEFFFGATIGKMVMRLRVISQTNETSYAQLTFRGALLRNLVRFVDASFDSLLGWVVCMYSPRRRRLGDIVAKTLVVRKDSVSDLPMSRQRMRLGAQVMSILCLVIAIGCPVFTYFWQPPILIQNNVTTQQLYFNQHITHYTLGEKSLGTNEGAQPTVSYPINFTSVDLLENKTQSCQGVVILVWQWADLSWQQDLAGSHFTCP